LALRLTRIKRALRWRRFPVDWIQDGGENRKSGFSDFGQVDGNPIDLVEFGLMRASTW